MLYYITSIYLNVHECANQLGMEIEINMYGLCMDLLSG